MILHMDHMEFLELDVNYSAELMADALAVIHGRAKYDGRDIEFMLGSAPMTVRHQLDKHDFSNEKPAQSTWKEAMNQTAFTKRTIHLSVLDYNQCPKHKYGRSGDRPRCRSLLLKDPYYSRPLAPLVLTGSIGKSFKIGI